MAEADGLSRLLRDCRESDGWWIGVAHLPLWGGELEVWVEPDEGGPDGPVLDIVRAILAYPGDLRPEVERAVFQLYTEQAPYDTVDYGEDDDGRDLAELRAPRLAGPSEIWRLLTLQQLVTWEYKNDPERAAFHLSFGCTWDREHGIQVQVERWAVSIE